MKQSTFPAIVSTTGHVFSVVRVTLCTICLKHEKTGEAYVVIFTDCHNIRDYKKGVVPVSWGALSGRCRFDYRKKLKERGYMPLYC
ncbi:hypothetical protein NQB67_25550 (plasmid) [Escherichia coli]|nr:hypothetical protein NQB67_25550 [Escherichia coli]